MSKRKIQALAERNPQPPSPIPEGRPEPEPSSTVAPEVEEKAENKSASVAPTKAEDEILAAALSSFEILARTSPSRVKASAMSTEELRDKCERAYASLVLYEAQLTRAPSHRFQALRRSDRERWVGRGPTSAESRHIAKLTKLLVYRYEVPRPEDNTMRGIWVYALKGRAHSGGELEASARYAGDGRTQIRGVDHGETHCPTSHMTSFLVDEARAAQDPSIIREIWDCIGAYYLTIPSYRQFVVPPPGYSRIDKSGRPMMWRLLRCLPGSKDAGNQFNAQFTAWLVEKAQLVVNSADASTFHRIGRRGWISLKVHVDDVAVHGKPQALIDEVFVVINARFPLKRRAGINLMLGVTIERSPAGIKFSQKDLLDDVWEIANLKERTPLSTPFPVTFSGFTKADLRHSDEERGALSKYPYLQLVGKLGYVSRCSRPDLQYEVALLRRFPAYFGPRMVDLLERLITYAHQTRDRCLVFRSGYDHPQSLFAFVDASYACCTLTRTSHGSWVIYFLGCPILTCSRKQSIVALSTMESEFNAAFGLIKDLAFVSQLLPGFGIEYSKPVPILEDNTAACYLAEKPNLQSRRTRHMDVRCVRPGAKPGGVLQAARDRVAGGRSRYQECGRCHPIPTHAPSHGHHPGAGAVNPPLPPLCCLQDRPYKTCNGSSSGPA